MSEIRRCLNPRCRRVLVYRPNKWHCSNACRVAHWRSVKSASSGKTSKLSQLEKMLSDVVFGGRS